MTGRTISTPLPTSPVTTTSTSPPARRLRTTSWLNLRLALGVLLVLVSVLLGARVVGAADSSVLVWSLRQDIAAGTTLTAGDLRPARVRLWADADRYVRTGVSPAGRTLTRDIGAGELLPRAALTTASPGRLVSLPVPALHVPDSLRRGQRVDVFATAKSAPVVTSSGTAPSGTMRVLAGVPVQSVLAPRGGLVGGGTDIAVLVSVPPDQVAAIVAALRTADIDVTIVTGGDTSSGTPAR